MHSFALNHDHRKPQPAPGSNSLSSESSPTLGSFNPGLGQLILTGLPTDAGGVMHLSATNGLKSVKA